MNDDSSDARNSAALASSSARPSRPIGMCTSRRCLRSGSLMSSSSIGVAIGPGQSEFARMFWRAYSTAISRVIESTPPLLAVYAICAVAAPTSATNDATLTIDPPPEASIAGMPYLQPSQTPLRFTSITRSHVGSGVSVAPPSSAGKMPALL